MPLNLVLVTQRQSADGLALSWTPMEDVTSYQVFVSQRRLSPEELEAAQALGGTDECLFAKVGAGAKSVVDDVTPQGEARFYAVAMVFKDGSVRPARFRTLPDGKTEESVPLSALRGGAARAVARPAVRSAGTVAAGPRPVTSAGYRVSAPAAAAAEDPLEARKRAQREARERAAGTAPAPNEEAPPPAAAEDAIEARKRAQREARERAAAGSPAVAPAVAAPSAEPPPPPSAVPLDGALEFTMKGATQTWDGLRLYWEREPRAAAYEVIVSDHQIFEQLEVRDALAGKADFTTALALAPSVTAVIDNVTAREARGWYAVIARFRDGKRAPHPFRIGDAASSGKKVAPFLNANRTGEVRAEADDLISQAREQWTRWKAEQDAGARREARRLVDDALLIFPNHPGARALLDEMGAGG